MNDIPDRCPKCDVPLKLSMSGRVPGIPDVPLSSGPAFYCPRCKDLYQT